MNSIKRFWHWCFKTEIGRFVIAGQIVMLLDIGSYYISLMVLGDSGYIVAHNISSIFSSVANFYIQKYWVFNNREPGMFWKQVLSYTLSTLMFIFVSNFVIWFLVSVLNLGPMTGKLIKIGIMGVVSWFMSKKTIFQSKK